MLYIAIISTLLYLGLGAFTLKTLNLYIYTDIFLLISPPPPPWQMFDRVHSALARGESLGIFPEGGSHDHTHLLPLKVPPPLTAHTHTADIIFVTLSIVQVGIAAIAFGAMEKYAVNVPIVPVGLTYYRGHRFRGRVVVEFGAPLRIDKDMYQTYRNSKRDGYKTLLARVEESMKST